MKIAELELPTLLFEVTVWSPAAVVVLVQLYVALYGELGAGKTQFAKGFASGLGVRQTVNSPSFVLMAEYAGRLPLYHLDLYRLADASEALAGGLLDERQVKDGGVLWQCRRLFVVEDLMRRDVLAEWESWTIHDHEVRQLEQSPVIFPGLDFLVHICSDYEQKVGTWMRVFHRIECLNRVTPFEDIYFYCRRPRKALHG